ncbi:FAD-dependent monooxygenase [Uliginosibacterium sp. TH139]|uniref:FAD-dependent monooxygenase n=1 Tax=Uliginosibacterium sp. TH139 TaxID=2067453 RepID=UPI000C7AF7F4|nr:FAD-dependent monooxygenase [Uliginosibacterium sp. TH139]PLK48039.1 2-octaprenyl-6-methoxyphenyl hydroxylase [Uliginosibacterium sp. TH139]
MAPPIAIIGAGPLGLATALALSRRGQAVEIFDARSLAATQQDNRTLALSHGSRELLELLGAWPAALATPITHITISQQSGFARSQLSAAEQRLPALGYVLGASALHAALLRQVQAAGIPLHEETRLESSQPEAAYIELQLQHATSQARLLLRCEGFVPEQEATRIRDYDQHALLCRATPVAPHQNLAHERFTARGPIALLPFGQDYAVVWTVPAQEAEGLLTAPEAEWLGALNGALGGLATLNSISERAHHPLGLRMRREITAPRCVWLGNAAQTLHPVAGQGFNLALRDAWELADTLTGASDPGAPELLARYAARRKLDREGAAGFTDLLVRGFSTHNPLISGLRGAGLAALEVLPPLRHFVAKRMIYGARAWP